MVMLTSPVCVNLQDRHGRTPLHAAVAGGHAHTVECLIKHGADVELRAESGIDRGRSPLHTAALVGECDIVHFLLKHGACVNSQDASGYAPLHLAAIGGHVSTVSCLIELGGNCDLQDVGGKTPLHTCFDEKDGPSKNHKDVAMLLIPNTNLHHADHKGRVALHLASLWDCGGMIELMLTRDVDINVRDADGNTPLHYAFLNEVHINMAAARVLLTHGVDLQLTDGSRKSPIHALMKHQRLSDPDMKDMVCDWATLMLPAEFGSSLLHLATIGGNTDVARFLLACGVDPNMADSQGRCPLHLAAIGGRLDLIRVLLKNGACVGWEDGDGADALHYAAELPRVTAVKMLLKEDAMLEKGDRFGQSALHRAAGWGGLDTVKHLVFIGADINMQSKGGLQPLHLAARENQEEIAEYLMAKGANVHCRDARGNTPLHLAAIEGNCDLIRALYVNGALINDVNTEQQTPLHLACFHGNAESVQTLLNRSANAVLRDSDNNRAKDLALAENHSNVLRILRNFQKSIVLYAQEQIPLVVSGSDPILQSKHGLGLNCLRPLVSVESVDDEGGMVSVDTDNDDKLSVVEEVGETIRLLNVNCMVQPQDEVKFYVVNEKDDEEDEVNAGSLCPTLHKCCNIS